MRRVRVLRAFSAIFLCVFVAAFATVVQASNIRPPALLADDTSGVLLELPLFKENLFRNARAELTFDVEYVYKSTTLLGDPLILCGATLRNPKGHVSYEYERERASVQVTSEANADLINPYHVSLLVGYRVLDGRVFYTSCSTGVTGNWHREPLNIASAPRWDRFICAPISDVPQSPRYRTQPKPDLLQDDWCEKIGGNYLNAESAQKLFRGQELRASIFVVASLSLDVGALVRAEIAKRSAGSVAARLEQQLRQVVDSTRPSTNASPAARRTIEETHSAIEKAIADAPREDAAARVGALRDAIRAVHALNQDGNQEQAAALRQVQAFLAEILTSDDARTFFDGQRDSAERLAAEYRRSAEEARKRLAALEDAVRLAPEFHIAGAGAAAHISRQIWSRNISLGETTSISSVTFSPQTNYIIVINLNSPYVHVADINEKVSVVPLKDPSSSHSMTCAKIAPDGKYAYFMGELPIRWRERLSDVGTITDSEVMRISGLPQTSRSFRDGCDLSPDGRILAVPYYNPYSLGIVDLQSPEKRWISYQEDYRPTHVRFDRSGDRILVASKNQQVHPPWTLAIIDRTGTVQRRFSNDTSSSSLRSLEWTPDGKQFIILKRSSDDLISYHNSETGEVVRLVTRSDFPEISSDIVDLEISPDGRHFALQMRDGSLRIVESDTLKELRRFEGTPFTDRQVRNKDLRPHKFSLWFSPDGSHLAAIDGSGLRVFGPSK